MVSIQILGALEVRVGKGVEKHFGRVEAEETLVLLALKSQMTREQLKQTITSEEEPDKRRRQRIENALSDLRTKLGKLAIEEADGYIRFNPKLCRVDLTDLKKLVQAGRLHQAKALLRGDVLHGAKCLYSNEIIASEVASLGSLVEKVEAAPTVEPLDFPDFPINGTEILGVEDRIFDLSLLLADYRTRLVTLWGMSGIGKSSLVLEFAAAYQRRSGIPIIYADLSEVRTKDQLESTLYRAAGGTEGEGQLMTYVSRKVGSRNVLLILDDCQKVLDDVQITVRQLLKECRGLTVLVTSQERLNLESEILYALEPLAVGETSVSYEVLIDRVRRIRPSWEPDAEEVNALAAITKRLEGIPLALRLMASQIADRGCLTALEDLEATLLRARQPGAVPHQVTLQAALENSLAYRTPRERTFFNRLTVLCGSFDLGTASAVAGVPRQEANECLVALVRAALVTEVARDRWKIREVFRITGWASITSEHAELRQKRLEHFRERIAQAIGAGDDRALRALLPDLDNLRDIVSSGLEGTTDLEETVRFLDLASDYWLVNCLYREFYTYVFKIVEHIEVIREDCEPETLIRILSKGGRHAGLQDDFDSASILYAIAMEICRDAEIIDTDLILNYTILLLVKGEYENALEVAERLRGVSELDQDVADAEYCLALAKVRLGDFDSAYTHFEKALNIYKKTDRYGNSVKNVLYNQIELGIITGSVSYGENKIEEAYGYVMPDDDLNAFEWNLRNQEGLLFYVKGEYARALECHIGALDFFRRNDQQRAVAASRLGCGRARVKLGEYEQAEEDLLFAAEYFNSLSDARNEAVSCERLAVLYHAIGHQDKVNEMLVRARAIRYRANTPILPIDLEEIKLLEYDVRL